MIRSLALVAFSFLAMPAVADPVRVQTGEHESFSRVVLTIPDDTEWELGRVEDGYAVRLSVQDGFDTRGFFDLIPRDRILGVSQNDEIGELRLVVDCECSADAFLDQPNILVLDIRDGAAPDGSPFERQLDGQIDAAPEDVIEKSASYSLPDQPLLPILVVPRELEIARTQLPQPQSEGQDATASMDLQSDALVAPQVSNIDEDLASLEQSIAESLARGLSQGLLEGDLNDDAGRNSSGGDLLSALGLEEELAPGIEASTSVDRASVPPDPSIPLTQVGGTCAPREFFDVAAWGDDRPYAVQISEARSALVEEFDRLDEQAVLSLARRYAYFGFGREAIKILELDGVKSQERRYLVAIAQIIDGDPIEEALFVKQVSCASEVALWAMLAPQTNGLDALIDRPAVLRAFKSLPFGLQSHLGPRLADRFIAIGDNDGASQALAVLRSDPDPPSLEAVVAETSLTRALGDEQAAAEQLADIATTETRVTPEIMTAFLIEAVEKDLPISDDDFILADALRFENGQLPQAADLAVAQVRAYLDRGNLDAADAILTEEAEGIGEERTKQLQDEFSAAAVSNLDDVAFLEFAFERFNTAVSVETENAIAARLLSIGFPDKAMGLVMIDASGDAGLERRYLRAQSAMAVGDPEAAMVTLAGLDTDRATQLRLIASDMRDGDVIVADALAGSGSAEALWRRGDWRGLVDAEDSLLSAASMSALEQEIAQLDPERPLGSGLDLLEQSAQSRAVLDTLLDRFASPEDF